MSMRAVLALGFLAWVAAAAPHAELVQQEAKPAATDLVQSGVQGASAVKKVVAMMTDMIAKGKREKQDEQIRFASYKQFCASTSKEKQGAIIGSKGAIDQLEADIDEGGVEIMSLVKQIAAHDADIDQASTERAQCTASRKKEKEDFEKEREEYAESIDAVERAEGQITSASGAELSFAQQRVSLVKFAAEKTVPDSVRKAFESYLLQSDDGDDLSDMEPEADAFQSQSGGILGMVKKMGEKFEDKKLEIEKEEMNKQAAFEMMSQDLTDTIESATSQREKKASRMAQLKEQKGANEGDFKQTQTELAEDEKFLADLNIECKAKSRDFEKRQDMRQGEIDAINKAIEIMNGGAVAGGTQYMDFHQAGASVAHSLAQMRSATVSALQRNVAQFLTDKAGEMHSRLLSLVAVRVREDPFNKVTKMVKDMIQKLMEEANEEAEHKGFCDTEMSTNKQTRDAKMEEVEELNAEVDKLSADIQDLANELVTLSEEIAATDAAVAKATSERELEKAKNQATIADSKAAQEATLQASAVLKDYYEQAGAAASAPEEDEPEGPIKYDNRALTILSKQVPGASFAQLGSRPKSALVQVKVPGAPEMEEGAYSGMGNGGILGLLEVIESDFARLISETGSAEQQASGEYDRFMADSAEDKAVKETDVKNKNSNKIRKEGDLQAAQKDLKTTKEELEAAMDYFEKLKPSCVEQGVSYEERVSRRKEEIESLQEALKILAEDTP